MAEALQGRRRTIAFLVVLMAFAMDLIDMTILNVATPTIQSDLRASPAALQWMVAGYSMIFAVLLILGGRLGDMFGYRRVFIVGVAAFTAASLACGAAPTSTALVWGRLVQGGAAALMLPQVLSLLQIMYAPHERLAALSLFGVLGGVCAVLGPILGGLIIGADLFGLSWRPIFLINVPVGLACAFLAARLLPTSRSPQPPPLDWLGALLIGCALVGLLYPMIQGRESGWPAWVFMVAAAGAALLGAFLLHTRRRMRRIGSALIPPALFSDRAFSLGLAITLVFQLGAVGLLFILTLVLQRGLGLDARSAGLLHAPYALGAMLAIGFVSRRLFGRFGARLIVMGAGLMAAGLAALAWTGLGLGVNGPGLALQSASLFVMGLGMGLISGPLSPLTLANVDKDHAGAASGVLKSVQQFGAAAGAALVGAVYFALAGPTPMSNIEAFRVCVVAIAACLGLVAGGGLAFPTGLLKAPR